MNAAEEAELLVNHFEMLTNFPQDQPNLGLRAGTICQIREWYPFDLLDQSQPRFFVWPVTSIWLISDLIDEEALLGRNYSKLLVSLGSLVAFDLSQDLDYSLTILQQGGAFETFEQIALLARIYPLSYITFVEKLLGHSEVLRFVIWLSVDYIAQHWYRHGLAQLKVDLRTEPNVILYPYLLVILCYRLSSIRAAILHLS